MTFEASLEEVRQNMRFVMEGMKTNNLDVKRGEVIARAGHTTVKAHEVELRRQIFVKRGASNGE